MSIKRSQTETGQTYFCTFTCLHWLPLFELTNSYDRVYKFFSVLIEKGHQVEEFVIMPNHLHVLLYVGNEETTINTLLSNGKRFLAYEMVNRLEKAKRTDILNELAQAVSREEKERKKKHRVFEISSDIKPCYYESYLLQKLNYIHSNPVRGKWVLAATPEAYLHSSAAFYELNQPHPFVRITHYKEVIFSSAPHRPL